MLHVPQRTPSQLAAIEIRDRLRNPPNAVKDDGIDLKRPKVLPFKPIPSPVESQMINAAVDGGPIPQYTSALDEMAMVRARMHVLRKEMDALREKYAFLEDVVDDVRRPKIEDVQRVVCKFYGISRVDMLSSRRTMNVVRPRQVAMYLAKTLTLRSLPELGRRFGQRDHTTVLHSVRKLERERANSPDFDAELTRLIDIICPHVASASNQDEAQDATTQPEH